MPYLLKYWCELVGSTVSLVSYHYNDSIVNKILIEIEMFIFVYCHVLCSGRKQITSYVNKLSLLTYLWRIIKTKPELQEINFSRAAAYLNLFAPDEMLLPFTAIYWWRYLHLWDVKKNNYPKFQGCEDSVSEFAFNSCDSLWLIQA